MREAEFVRVSRMLCLLFLTIAASERTEILRARCGGAAVEIESFYSCDVVGNPQKYFPVNMPAYFYVSTVNRSPESKNVGLSVSVRDSLNVALGVSQMNITLEACATTFCIVSFSIPEWAFIGNSTANLSLNVEGVPAESCATDLYIWHPISISVANITTSKSIVGQGFAVQVNAVIQNLGPQAEAFNVTVYANETPIQSVCGIVLGRNSTIVDMTWNTTNAARGNHTLSTVTEIVMGEYYVVKSSSSKGSILVVIPGNVNGDNLVNVLDLYLIASSFSKTGPDCDVNGDGNVDMIDMYIGASNFAKHEE